MTGFITAYEFLRASKFISILLLHDNYTKVLTDFKVEKQHCGMNYQGFLSVTMFEFKHYHLVVWSCAYNFYSLTLKFSKTSPR